MIYLRKNKFLLKIIYAPEYTTNNKKLRENKRSFILSSNK
jgi:hypothetical protein